MDNPHLRILVQMAKVDGQADESELELIRTIGASNNVTDEDIEKVINEAESSDPISGLDSLSKEAKMELLYNLTLVMKADGIVHKEEMKFCLGVIKKLGFDENVLFELISNTVVDTRSVTDHDELIRKAEQYYKK
ncbi:MAG: TerB family tellurite resistance protein [Cyclobacteriaceae bacterium]|nr:TerB family tellurite resistance protein [Cyclobacteriaceae bacterium]